MKTAIRTYHPIPALQKTNGNLQDAPRIKNILKSCLLDGEAKAGVPSTPVDILSRSVRDSSSYLLSILSPDIHRGREPFRQRVSSISFSSWPITQRYVSTEVVPFQFSYSPQPLAQMHFENSLDFLDLFLPINVSSASRARAFLWLCYHYLESSTDNASSLRNPFADPHVSHPNKIPPLVTLTQEEMELENVDSEDEIAWGEKMLLQRKEFQARMGKGKDKKAGDGEDGNAEGAEEAEPKEKGKGKGRGSVKDIAAAKANAKEKKAAADKARRQRQKEAKKEREAVSPALEVEDVVGKRESCKCRSTSCSPGSFLKKRCLKFQILHYLIKMRTTDIFCILISPKGNIKSSSHRSPSVLPGVFTRPRPRIIATNHISLHPPVAAMQNNLHRDILTNRTVIGRSRPRRGLCYNVRELSFRSLTKS